MAKKKLTTPSGEKKFDTLGDAFKFLDEEYQEVRQKTDLFFHHAKELMRQLAEQALQK